jgi:ribosome biogenesis protein Nip4
MKPINDFISRFHASIIFNESLIVKKENRYFLLNETLKSLITENFFYAGTYLGKIKNGKFFPSFSLLRMIAEGKANKIIVNDKTAWLFICGRDIFKQGILKAYGSKRKGDYTLILNQHRECLGFGKILNSLGEERKGLAIKNISDIGDFLRRERQQA